MLTNANTQQRTDKASLLLKTVRWVMSRQKPVFPHTPDEYRDYMANRELPHNAAMPDKFAQKYDVTGWEAAGQHVVTLHPKSGPAEWHMLYFHGGGVVFPTFKEHWPLVAAMVDKYGVSITVPLYEVVPESSHKAQDDLADAVLAKLTEGHDLFIIDSRSIAARLSDLGVDVMLYEYAGAPHVFMAVVLTRESKDTLKLLSDFLESQAEKGAPVISSLIVQSWFAVSGSSA